MQVAEVAAEQDALPDAGIAVHATAPQQAQAAVDQLIVSQREAAEALPVAGVRQVVEEQVVQDQAAHRAVPQQNAADAVAQRPQEDHV
jgi:hypothetical protein